MHPSISHLVENPNFWISALASLGTCEVGFTWIVVWVNCILGLWMILLCSHNFLMLMSSCLGLRSMTLSDCITSYMLLLAI